MTEPSASGGTPPGARGGKPAGRRPRALRVLHGVGAARGITVGRALVLDRGSTQVFRADVGIEEVETEIERLHAALVEAREQVARVRSQLRERSGDEYAFIFEAHELLLQDTKLVGDAVNRVRTEKINAEWAWHEACRKVERVLSSLDDPYLRERAHDVADIHDRVQRVLAGSVQHHDLSELTEDVIIVAHSLPPSEAASLSHEHVAGFLTEVGGPTSHTAIVAKSLGIPAIVGLKNALTSIPQGALVAMDGRRGQVVVSPNEAALIRWVRRARAYDQREERLILNRDLPAVTLDGERVTLRANIELVEEIDTALEHGAEGVGLYRSEFLFLRTPDRLPSEEEHYETYATLVRRMAPLPVTIRTIDLGGEKYHDKMVGPGEANPVLGLRAIRLALARPDVIEPQMRAILRAAALGDVRVMFPLISAAEELETIRGLIARAAEQLVASGQPHRADIPVGIMIEVPSAASIADRLARRVDFFAIGTNDLIQYTLAVDRGNEHVSYLYQPLHPAVLRLIRHAAESARVQGIGVSVCGEMAADPVHAAILIGMGIRDLSMDPVSMPAVKEMIRCLRASDLRALVSEAFDLDSASAIHQLVNDRLAPALRSVTGRSRPSDQAPARP